MRKSGICFCGAELNEENRVDTKYVSCPACGTAKVQMYTKNDRLFDVEFVTARVVDRAVFYDRLAKAGVIEPQLMQVPDDRTATKVSGQMRYIVRGGWSMDIRRKVAASLTYAGIPTRKDQVAVRMVNPLNARR